MPPRRSCFRRGAAEDGWVQPGFNATTAFLLPYYTTGWWTLVKSGTGHRRGWGSLGSNIGRFRRLLRPFPVHPTIGGPRKPFPNPRSFARSAASKGGLLEDKWIEEVEFCCVAMRHWIRLPRTSDRRISHGGPRTIFERGGRKVRSIGVGQDSRSRRTSTQPKGRMGRSRSSTTTRRLRGNGSPGRRRPFGRM
jgi:hypothetical protein